MKIYSFQPLELVQSLFQKKIVYPQSNLVFPKDDQKLIQFFQPSYRWIAQKFHQRNPKPSQTEYPFWGYYQWRNHKEKKPDLRCLEAKTYCKNKDYCLLELNIPEKELLLSDYEAWHFVLNRWYFTFENIKEAKEKELNKNNLSLYQQDLLPQEILDLIEKSWDSIFDLSLSAKILDSDISKSTIQANFWSIEKKHLQQIIVFSKNAPKKIFRQKNFDFFQKQYLK